MDICAVFQAQVLYNFTAEPGNNELSVREGETLTVLSQTVGRGWIEVQNSSGRTGLVPEGYLQVSSGESSFHVLLEPVHVSTVTELLQDRRINPSRIVAAEITDFTIKVLSPSAVDDEDGEWDDDWDDQSVGGYHGNNQLDGEGGASGQIITFIDNSTTLVVCALIGSCSLSNQMGEVGPVWLYPSSSLDCVIADPKKESKLYGLKSFIEYQLTPSTTNRPVNHRYKHFDWLYERLLEKFGSALPIPPLPDKQVTGRFEEDFIRMRMEHLQAWMSRMCRHPVVSQSDVFQLFLTYRDEKEWKAGKRRTERDEAVGPMIFTLIESEAAELDAAQVEQRCEQYSQFTKSMDDGVRELLNVGHAHWKRCTGPLPKEYKRIGRAFRNLSNVFNSSKYPGEETLTNAMTVAGETYEEIAVIVAQQPQKDLHFLLETNSEYKGLLSCFPEIIAVHKAAVEKVKEADRLVSAGKINNNDRKWMNQRISCMSYSLQAEMNHFHSNRIYDYNRVMQLYLEQQVTFYQQIADKLRAALSQFTTL
uniref:Sorting nexin-9-like n=1 Tax=Seriola dumerili TaxID=41447 RepID=A0A3B4TIF7_SERDU